MHAWASPMLHALPWMVTWGVMGLLVGAACAAFTAVWEFMGRAQYAEDERRAQTALSFLSGWWDQPPRFTQQEWEQAVRAHTAAAESKDSIQAEELLQEEGASQGTLCASRAFAQLLRLLSTVHDQASVRRRQVWAYDGWHSSAYWRACNPRMFAVYASLREDEAVQAYLRKAAVGTWGARDAKNVLLDMYSMFAKP
jgi:hypothetical protein